MGENPDKAEKEIESEIDESRHELEADIAQREREAKERLDEILSEKKMEFCSRCNRKISSRTDWAGRCMWTGCENLICRDCWDVHKYKYCRNIWARVRRR